MQLWLQLPAFLGSCPPASYLDLYVLKSYSYSSSISSIFTTFAFGLSHKDCYDIIERKNKIGKELPLLTRVFFHIFDRHMSLMMTPLSEVRQRECDLQFDLLYQSVWNVCQAFILATEVAIRWERKLGRGSQVPLPTCCWKWHPQACQLGEPY